MISNITYTYQYQLNLLQNNSHYDACKRNSLFMYYESLGANKHKHCVGDGI